MIYRELNATFGNLNEQTLQLTDGLNVIYGPNGTGKSTWSAFLRVMLYGISTREQNKIGFLADKEKYKPWSGVPMYGKLRMTVGDRPLCLERTAGKNGLLQTMTAVYEDSGRPAELSEPPGEQLLGMKREVFERSVFTAQGALSVGADKDGELARKITALVQTGDADTNFSLAKARLEKWRRAKRYHKSGLIPDLEERLRRDRTLLEELRRDKEQREELFVKKRILVAELERLRAQIAWKKLEQIRLAEETLILAEKRCTAELSEERQAALELLERLYFERNPADTKKDVSHETFKTLALGAGIGGVAAAAVGLLTSWLVGVVAGAAVFAVVCLFRRKKRKKIATPTQEELLAALRDVDPKADVTQIRSVLARERLRGQQAKQDARFAEERLELLLRDVDHEELVRCAEHAEELPERFDSAAASARMGEIERSIYRLEMETTAITSRMEAKGTIAEVEARITAQQAELSAAEAEYQALTVALDTLCEVNGTLERSFAPVLEKTAGELLARITDGQFCVVEWSGSDGSLTVREHPAAPPRNILSLSRGTLDELYLCLRLAICETVLDGEESVPLVLDDVFAFCDDERLVRMLSYLKELAQKRQIILFTCHKRESLLLQGDSAVHTVTLG
ncbi:MAG: AAA family ATPase [Oscillospiraceae bacterium]|nr:AAA family ATPase [Oscillospiraceae bacterium]